MSFTVYTITLDTTTEDTEKHDAEVREMLKRAVAPLDANPLIEIDEHDV